MGQKQRSDWAETLTFPGVLRYKTYRCFALKLFNGFYKLGRSTK